MSTLIERAEEVLETALVAFVSGDARLVVCCDKAGVQWPVLTVDGVAYAVIVLDPARYPVPAAGMVH